MEHRTIDKKLDNKRLSLNGILLKISFDMGDKEIKTTKLQVISHSGYCYDINDHLSVSFGDIMKLSKSKSYTTGKSFSWDIICYPEQEQEALNIIKEGLVTYKNALIEKAMSIPV